MNFRDWCKESRGRQAAVAAFLRVPATNVSQWTSGLKQPSIKTAVAIEQFTGGRVTRKDLFPNDWRQIWPELAGAAAGSQEVVHEPSG